MQLPKSVLTSHQAREYRAEWTDKNGHAYRMVATVRYDDQCRNGHNTFSVTANVVCKEKGTRFYREHTGGCCHNMISKHIPELAPFIKWHLVSSDGPLHYVGNTVYHASDKDHWGLRKGEKRQIKNGKTGIPSWRRVIKGKERPEYIDSMERPESFNVTVEYEPWCHVGEGKERDLSAARSCAVWPDATDDELLSDNLAERLAERLPALMQEFKTAIESLGFVY